MDNKTPPPPPSGNKPPPPPVPQAAQANTTQKPAGNTAETKRGLTQFDGRSLLGAQLTSTTQAKVDLAALALRLRDEQVQAKVIYFGADQKTNKDLDAITEAVIAELGALRVAKTPASSRSDVEIELIGNLRGLLEKLFSSRREAFLKRKIEDIQRRITTLFFNSELFTKIQAGSTEARTFSWPDQAVYYALLKNRDVVLSTLKSMTYAKPEVLQDALDRYGRIEKGLRMEFLSRTTPELEKLLVIYVKELTNFFTEDFRTNMGEFCWEVIRGSRIAEGKPLGYKLDHNEFSRFREAFEKKFLERIVLTVQGNIVKRASEEKDAFREETMKFVANPQIFVEICSVICDSIYDFLHSEGFLDLPAQWRTHLYRQQG